MVGSGTLLNTITNNFSATFTDEGTYHSEPDFNTSSGELTVDDSHRSSSSYSAVKAYANLNGYGTRNETGTASASTTFTESAIYYNSVGLSGTDETYSGDNALLVIANAQNHAYDSGGYSGGYGGQLLEGADDLSYGAFVSSSYSASGNFIGDSHSGNYANLEYTLTSQTYSDVGTGSAAGRISDYNQWYSVTGR
jgi:hypothetical protein